MKIVCDCGNEMTFNTIDKETGEEAENIQDECQYATIDSSKFGFWSGHDVVGMYCEKCNKGIWLFT